MRGKNSITRKFIMLAGAAMLLTVFFAGSFCLEAGRRQRQQSPQMLLQRKWYCRFPVKKEKVLGKRIRERDDSGRVYQRDNGGRAYGT